MFTTTKKSCLATELLIFPLEEGPDLCTSRSGPRVAELVDLVLCRKWESAPLLFCLSVLFVHRLFELIHSMNTRIPCHVQ